MRIQIGVFLIQVCRVSFLLHVIMAAAVYGLTRESGIQIFNISMGCTVMLWICGHLIAGRFPRIGLWLPLISLGVISLAGFVTLGAMWDPASDHSFTAPEWLSDFALRIGTFDLPLSMAAIARTSVLLGALWIATDLFTEAAWTRAVLLTIAITSGGMVMLYFLQRLAPDVFSLRSENGQIPLSFATYRYWGNAASFLNLMWPVLAGIALHNTLSKAKGWSGWCATALICFAALFFNLSKAGQVLGLIGLLTLGIICVFLFWRNRRALAQRISLPVLLGGAIPIILILAALPFAVPWQRWDSLAKQGTDTERLQAYPYFVQLIPEAGWTGFGPGTFRLVYYQYFSDVPVMNTTPFWVAHQDYIQTLVEWGYLGTALWALLLVPPALALLISGIRKTSLIFPSKPTDYEYGWSDKLLGYYTAIPTLESPFLKLGAFLAIFLTALHSAVDFPMQIESLQFYFLIWIGAGWRILLDRRRRLSKG